MKDPALSTGGPARRAPHRGLPEALHELLPE
jgi:hypothetical protein